MRSTLVSILLIAILSTAFLACREAKPDESGDQVPSLPLPTESGLFLVGNDHGMIRPCGCSKPLLGGIVRRGAFFAAVDQAVLEDSTILALGGMIEEGGRQQELKLEAFLESLAALESVAILPNENDLLVGSRFWTDLIYQRKEDDCPLVATNLMVNGARLFDAFALIEHEGQEIVVASWLWPESGVLSEPGVELAAMPDLTEVEAALRNEKGEKRNLILYSSAPESIAHAYLLESGLKEAAAEVLLLISGPSDLPIIVRKEEHYLACELGQKGRDVTRLDWPARKNLEHFSLVEAYGDHARQQEILDFYRGNVAFEDLLLNAAKFEMAEDSYVGSEACANCHREAFDVWSKSRHAHAFTTLKNVGDDKDPECVRCHVVDFHRQGGFDPVSLEPVHVQCESCHGPSESHATDPRLKTARGTIDQQTCLQCHDLANSPHFDFETYWPKIQHGK